jgi:hypothetical protein
MSLGARWIEPIRRNQVKSSAGQELRTVIIKITDRNNEIRSLVHAVKKVQKLWTVIIGAGSVNLQFENSFLKGIKRLLHPFVLNISQLTGE